ncbi:class I SAM-dependent methyltransferase [Arcanobacterium haemolyticum]|nr:class I SAM-dependent methyltransferase [Arcanobacterium haemolyticum]
MDVRNPFDTPAPRYSSVRPAYPHEAIAVIRERGAKALGRQVRTIADIGAGTGKMTAMLAASGACVTAVEPSETMRRQFATAMTGSGFVVDEIRGDERGVDCSATGAGRAPTRGGMNDDGEPAVIRLVQGSAEETHLATHAYDVAVFAQSWHWVDADRAADEATRILAPGGVIAAVWNQMDVTVPWVHRLSRIMRSGDVHRPDRPPRFGENFEEPHLDLMTWEQNLTPARIMELGTTRSSYLRQNAAGRARMQGNLQWYLYDHLGFEPSTDVAIPYTTLVWTAAVR